MTRVALVGAGAWSQHSAACALDAAGHDVASVILNPAGHWSADGGRRLGLSGAVAVLRSSAVVVPVLLDGEDGTVAMLCDLVAVPFVGSSRRVCALASHTRAVRLVARAAGVRTAPCDAAITGPEIDVAVLARPDGTRMVAPAAGSLTALGDSTRTELEEAAVTVFDALGCAGVARVDFVLADGAAVLTQVDAAPGLSEHSLLPRTFAAAGVSYAELLDLLVTDVVRRRRDR